MPPPYEEEGKYIKSSGLPHPCLQRIMVILRIIPWSLTQLGNTNVLSVVLERSWLGGYFSQKEQKLKLVLVESQRRQPDEQQSGMNSLQYFTKASSTFSDAIPSGKLVTLSKFNLQAVIKHYLQWQEQSVQQQMKRHEHLFYSKYTYCKVAFLIHH